MALEPRVPTLDDPPNPELVNMRRRFIVCAPFLVACSYMFAFGEPSLFLGVLSMIVGVPLTYFLIVITESEDG